MAKQSKKQRVRSAPVSKTATVDVNFVRTVAGIYHCIINRADMVSEWKLLDGNEQLLAREVAAGIVAIHRAIDLYNPVEDDGVWVNSKLCAWKLLEALVGRTDTAAWRYISNVRSVQRGRPPAAGGDRARFVGIVLALQEAAKRDGVKLSRKNAVAQAKTKCGFLDQSFTDQAMKHWIARGVVPDASDYQRLIIRQAEEMTDDRPLTSRVIDVAQHRYRLVLWRLPMRPEVPPFSGPE